MLSKKKRERVRNQTPRNKVKRPKKDRRNVYERRIVREFRHIIFPPSGKLAIRWNFTTAECYSRLLKCEGCRLREFCEKGNFAIRGVVRELVRTLSVQGIEPTLTPDEIKMLDDMKINAIIE